MRHEPRDIWTNPNSAFNIVHSANALILLSPVVPRVLPGACPEKACGTTFKDKVDCQEVAVKKWMLMPSLLLATFLSAKTNPAVPAGTALMVRLQTTLAT